MTAKASVVRSVYEVLVLNGFTEEVISVIPPEAKLTTSSKIPPEALGKVPGRKLTSGEWCGGWNRATDIQTAQRFARWGGNVGLETTRLLPVDIDVNDPALHKPLIILARRILGDLPLRMGKRPLLFGRLKGKCSYGRIYTTFENANGSHKIESFFGPLKHFVIDGVHPDGLLYRCNPGIDQLFYDSIPEITEKQVLDYFVAAEDLLAQRYKCKIHKREKDNAGQVRDYELPDKAKVIAPLPYIKQALNKIPNTKNRERWIDICHAVKGATQDNPEEGLALWLDWCQQREDGDPHLKEAKRVWNSAGRQDGGLHIGYQALLVIGGLHTELAQHEFKDAEAVADDLLDGATDPPLFTVQPVQSRPLRRPEWVVRNMVPKGACLGVMYGPPGMNKSTMATAMAVHVALGLPFAGQHVKAGNVLLISEEDAVVNRRRLEAWRHWLGSKKDAALPSDWEQMLRTRILETFPTFGHISKKKIAHLTKEVQRVTQGIGGIQLVFVDTLARTFVEGGEENEAKDMNKYIDLAEGMANALDCPVVILHHPPKSADTLRGHGSLLGAVSMVFKVERTEDGLVRLYCQKMREAAEFAPQAFERRAVDISFAVERKDDTDTDQETALVLEHTEWTEVSGNARQHGSAAADPANLVGSPQRVSDMDILRHLCLHPGDSVRTVAAALGFSGHSPLTKRLHRLHEFGLVEHVDKRWRATDAGRETFNKEHPEGLLM